jgi:hypothetical protein
MSNTPAVKADIKPGIYQGIPNEAYHAGPGISKSGLWTVESKSPAHYKYAEREEKSYFDFGDAAHKAILEPNEFEKKVVRGPVDRRGNKWTDAMEITKIDKKLLLTQGDYDSVLAIRDAVHADQWVNSIITGGKPMVEASAYWIDPETGELCRCRPDLYRPDLGIVVDVKTGAENCAHPDKFARAAINYGYHAQEAFYTDGMHACGQPVNGFAFLVWEKKAPYVRAVYELPPSIVDEGRAVMRKALGTYSECRKANHWPAYNEGVTELPIKKWAYRLTEAPSALDEEVAA